MISRHLILIVIIISLLLLFIATLYYPCGSQFDKNSIGFDWANNYLCNLFDEKAMNGSNNPSRHWAIAGMVFLSTSFALFFIRFSNKIPQRGSSNIIKYFGALGMLFGFLAVTPYHDLMVMLASTFALVSLFYITVYVFKSNLNLFKILCVHCLLISYKYNYIYYSGHYIEYLPIMQKVNFASITIWFLGLEYFTTAEDFQGLK